MEDQTNQQSDAEIILQKVKEIDPKTFQLALALCQKDALEGENVSLKAQLHAIKSEDEE